MRILIIEDDDFLRKVYADQFELAHFDVDCAENGQRALDCVKRTSYDIVLCDLLMPVMDGFTFITKVTQDKLLGNAPLIVLTNLGEEQDRVRAMQLGATDFYLKRGVNVDDLVQLVHSHLRH